MDNLCFQYCPKLIVFNEKMNKVLLARRKGEQDYDGIFSFIGGKIEVSDGGIIPGIQREKNEEIGTKAKLKFAEMPVFNAFFKKKDGKSMILPHHICIFVDGNIHLNHEYSEFQWVKLNELENFEPKIDTIITAVNWAKRYIAYLEDTDYMII